MDTSNVWSGFSFTAQANIASISIVVENITISRPTTGGVIVFDVDIEKNGSSVINDTISFGGSDTTGTIAVLQTGFISLAAADVITVVVTPQSNPVQQFKVNTNTTIFNQIL